MWLSHWHGDLVYGVSRVNGKEPIRVYINATFVIGILKLISCEEQAISVILDTVVYCFGHWHSSNDSGCNNSPLSF